MNTERSFVYVATGSGYPEEAAASARTLRNHHPDAKICLITDQTIDPNRLFDTVIPCEDAEHLPIDKQLALRCPAKQLVFLDTDTYVCGDLRALFDLLDRFDLALLQDVNRGWDYTLPGVPETFTEFNTGVMVLRNDARMARFFEDWRKNYLELLEKHGFINDQPSFRQTLYPSDLRVSPLPSEFHFLGNFPNALLWKARLIHARGNLPGMSESINAELGSRAYVPDVGGIRNFQGRRHWARSTFRIFSRMAALLLRPPVDSAKLNPRKWWEDETRSKRANSEDP